jgi:hypothetical protein
MCETPCAIPREERDLGQDITVKFVRVEKAYDHCLPFEQALATALALGAPFARERNINEGFPDPIFIRLERLETEHDFVFGEVTRKQTDNIPPEANNNGLTPIALSNNGGLGLSPAFRYHIPTMVLLIQANTQAVSQNRLFLYLKFINERCEYGCYPVPKESAWARFNRGHPRRLLLRVAAPTHIGILNDEGRSVAKGIADIGAALDAPYITLDISMGHRKGQLDRGVVTRVINAFKNIGDDGAAIETLSVSVSDEEGHDLIDFLDEHMVFKTRLDFPNRNPNGHYLLRKKYLEGLFNANLEYLNNTYAP